jgi:hypothetical protein
VANFETRLQINHPHLVLKLVIYVANCRAEQVDAHEPRYNLKQICLRFRNLFNPEIFSFEGHKKCRELWPDEPIEYEKVFNIFLDMILLVVPLFVLGLTYFMITKTLWQGIRTEREFKNQINKYACCK